MSETVPSIGVPRSVVESPESIIKSESAPFVGYLLVEKLIKERIIDGSILFEPSKENKERTAVVVEEVMSESNKSLIEPIEITEDVEVIEQKGKKILTDYITDLSDREIVSDNIITLTSRITRVEDIRVLQGEGGINYDSRADSGRFADEDGNNFIEISFGKDILGNRMTYYSKILNSLGVKTDQGALLEMALASIIGHEWSHSVQRAVKTDLALKLKADRRYSESLDDDLSVSQISRTSLFRAATRVVSETGVITDLKPADQEEVDSERFATGFEWDAATSVLRIRGFSEEIINGFRQEIIKDAEKGLDGMKSFFGRLRNLGIDLGDIPTVCMNARLALRFYNISIPDVIPRLWSDVGYEAGYTTNELKEILSLGEQEANRADLFNQIIEMRGKETDY